VLREQVCDSVPHLTCTQHSNGFDHVLLLLPDLEKKSVDKRHTFPM
jgi:hypothetical protein